MRESIIPTSVVVPLDGLELPGDLMLPRSPRGVVIFAHGSGSSRFSTRNRWVADRLTGAGFGTFLFDLLTRREEASEAIGGALRFDIRLLSVRLVQVTRWLATQLPAGSGRLGYFGASTGGAAALVAAAALPDLVAAVVSRGGRPDLAAKALESVRVPTLFIVGGEDREVLALNRTAMARLGTRRRELVVIPGAGHLFEEPGALAQVTKATTAWYERWLPEERQKRVANQ